LSLRHVYGSMEDILRPIQKHYTQQAIGEAYKVSGTFDFLGNPVGLFHNIATGFLDFFVEPSKGIIRSPEDFKEGLQKGSLSLLKNTIYGLANTTSKISETAARGFVTISMDNDYKQERERILRESPANVGEGIIQGARSFRVGLTHGIGGLAMVPVREVREEGTKGLAKGIPKGILGVFTKPIAGAIDFFSLSTQGVRNMSKPTPITQRRRPPRNFPLDGSLLVFQPEASYGQYLLESAATNSPSNTTKLDKDEEYRLHIIWNNSTTVLFTNKRVVCFADPRGFRRRWEVLDSNIAAVRSSGKGVKLVLKNPISKKSYSVGKVSTVCIECTESAAQQFMYKKTLEMLESLQNPQHLPPNYSAGYAAR